jgi:hypothetical protein
LQKPFKKKNLYLITAEPDLCARRRVAVRLHLRQTKNWKKSSKEKRTTSERTTVAIARGDA